MNVVSQFDPQLVQPSYDPVAAARALRPLVLENADQAERERRVPDIVIDAIQSAA